MESESGLSCVRCVAAASAWVLLYIVLGFVFQGLFPCLSSVDSVIAADATCLLACAAYCRSSRRRLFPGIRSEKPLASSAWRFFAFVLLWFCSYLLGNIIAALFYDPAMDEYIEMQQSEVTHFIALSVLLAPVVEEVLFRGVVYSSLRSRFGMFSSSVVSSALFGIMHGTLGQLVIGLFFGMGECFLFEHTKDLRWCIFGHMLSNALSFLISEAGVPVGLFMNVPFIAFLFAVSVILLVSIMPMAPDSAGHCNDGFGSD